MAIELGKALLYLNADPREFNRALVKAKRNAHKNMTGIMDLSQRVGKAFTGMGLAIAAPLALSVKEAMNFRSSLAEVATLGVNDLEALGDSAREVARTFGLDVTDAVNATYQAISAGASEAETPLVLEKSAIAATAGVTDLATAVDLGMGTVNAFGKEMTEITSVFDQAFTAVKLGVTTFEELAASTGKLAPIFDAANLSTKEMFASVSALTKGGISTKESVTAMRQAVQGIIKPTTAAQKKAEELGLEFNSQALAAQGLEGFLQNVKEVTGGNVDEMSELFTSSEALKGMLALTGAQSESFSDILDEMNSSAGASQEAFDRFVENNPEHAWKVLKAEIKDLAISIGKALLPVLKRVVDFARPIVEWIADFARENKALVSVIAIVAGALGGLLLVFGPLLIVLPGLVTFVSILSAALPFLGAAFAALLGPIGLVIAAVAAILAAVIYFWDEIVAYYQWVWDTITDIASGAWGELQWVWNTIAEGATWLYERMVEVFTGLKNFFAGVWELIVQGIQAAWERITGFLGSIISGVWEAIKAVGRLGGIGGQAGGPQVNMPSRGVGGPDLGRLPATANTFARDMGGANGGGGGITVNAPVYVPNAVNLDPEAADRVGKQVADGVNREIGERIRRQRG